MNTTVSMQGFSTSSGLCPIIFKCHMKPWRRLQTDDLVIVHSSFIIIIIIIIIVVIILKKSPKHYFITSTHDQYELCSTKGGAQSTVKTRRVAQVVPAMVWPAFVVTVRIINGWIRL